MRNVVAEVCERDYAKPQTSASSSGGSAGDRPEDYLSVACAAVDQLDCIKLKARVTGRSSLLTMDVDEKITDAVHEFPCLWEVSSKAYKDKDAIAKGNAWKEVSNKVTTHTRFFLSQNA